MIRDFHIRDAKALLGIYNYYVLNSTATFDDMPLALDVFEAKLKAIEADFPFIVFEEKGRILGYAYGSMFRPKPAYKNTVETTVYVKYGCFGKQIGSKLYSELLLQLRKQKYHVALGVLTLPNKASEKLHQNLGFKQVAHFEEVGLKFGNWLDVGVWQLKLD